VSQWQAAALQPPHLAAICPWEGASDYYREFSHHGGILGIFTSLWYPSSSRGSENGHRRRRQLPDRWSPAPGPATRVPGNAPARIADRPTRMQIIHSARS
jgi:uncharacterized protein